MPAPVAACLALQSDIWVFGYGSLMWDPGFRHCAEETAVLNGYHRSFCVYSHRHRGTKERPGLVLGLDRGGSCKGIAFKIDKAHVGEALDYLWDREMAGGEVYEMRRVPLRLATRIVQGYAFVVRRDDPEYTGRLSMEETARLIIQGIGGRGRCRDYLDNTVRHLEQLGLLDGALHKLADRVKALAAAEPPCGGR